MAMMAELIQIEFCISTPGAHAAIFETASNWSKDGWGSIDSVLASNTVLCYRP